MIMENNDNKPIDNKEPLEEEALDTKIEKNSQSEETKQAQDYYDRLIRVQAEFENYKKRTDREIADFKVFANAQLIKELLVVRDDFENAFAAQNNEAAEKFAEGMNLIFKNFYGILEKEGLCEIAALNEKFDPWKHEALEMVPTHEHPEHTILEVVQKGYKLNDKILRPAKVRVAALPENECKEPKDSKQEIEKENVT
jgi:molecular chaperone GrpE